MSDRIPAWSDLPEELLFTIAKTLNSNPVDVLTFRSVCTSWRTSCPPLPQPSILSPIFPLSLPPSPIALYKCSHLTVTIIYAVRRPLGLSSVTPNSWILFLDEYNSGKVSVHKPFSRGSYSLPINFPKTINLIDFSVLELGRYYNLSYLNKYDGWGYTLNKPRFYPEYHDKVVFFPDWLTVIAIFNAGHLGAIRLDVVGQSGTSEWQIIYDGEGFDDIVEFKGRVLGIDRTGWVYEIVYDSFEIKPVVPPVARGGGRRKRLVESLGLLYLVVRCNVDPCKTDKRAKLKVLELDDDEQRKTKFKVYELNEGGNKWVEVTSIDDRSFFFSHDFSFSASAQELGTSEKNCILFQNESFPSYDTDDGDYTLFSKSISRDFRIGVCHLNDAVHFGVIESYPDYLDILWPPPSWIWAIDRSKRLQILEAAIDEILDRIPVNFKVNCPGSMQTKINEKTLKQVRDMSNPFQRQATHHGDHAILEAVREVLKLKEAVIRFQEGEKKITDLEQKLQEAILNGFREFIDMLNQIENLVLPARSSTHGTVSRLVCNDELHTALEEADNGDPPLSHFIRRVLHEYDALLFQLEECITEMERFQKKSLAPILTG